MRREDATRAPGTARKPPARSSGYAPMRPYGEVAAPPPRSRRPRAAPTSRVPTQRLGPPHPAMGLPAQPTQLLRPPVSARRERSRTLDAATLRDIPPGPSRTSALVGARPAVVAPIASRPRRVHVTRTSPARAAKPPWILISTVLLTIALLAPIWLHVS